MHLSRLTVRNFRNFKEVVVPLNGNIVLLGENRVGKSNLLYAIRLVLDPALSESARQLKTSDFWDGCILSNNPQIEIHIELDSIDDDLAIAALLTDFRAPENPHSARLSYVFRRKPGIAEGSVSSEDYEFLLYGGDDESRSVPNRVRRRIAIDMLDALRDAEGQLASWRNSPLRPLIEAAIASVEPADLQAVAQDLESASAKMENFPSVKLLEDNLREGILNLSGNLQDINAKLRFAPSEPFKLFRAISMFIDGGKRSISEASLGSANVALIALKLAEFAWRRQKNERNYSILCIEEPEAHLHPQLQRGVFNKLFESKDPAQALIITTHSPTLSAIAKLRSVINLRSNRHEGSTVAYSLANLPVTNEELDDIQQYLTVTRSEILFSRGVIFVEGDAEETLLPVFAKAIGHNLDLLGISICNVAGTNFTPYVKLATGLGLPFVVITDWDPLDGSTPPLGKARSIGIIEAYLQTKGSGPLSPEHRAQLEGYDYLTFSQEVSKHMGIFLNDRTFEVAISQTRDLLLPLLDILDAQGFGSVRTSRIKNWRSGSIQVDPGQLLAMVADIGKGRLSAKLVDKITATTPPMYIQSAVNYLVSRV